MSSELKVYPSGFLGSAHVALTEPLSIEQVRHRLFDASAISNPDGHTANLEVVSLWDDLVAGDRSVNTFEFQEKILKCAKVAFDSSPSCSVSYWVNAQMDSPLYTEYHSAWIDETLAFVFEGRPREYSYNVWYGLLTSDAGHPGKRLSPFQSKYFGARGLYNGASMFDLIAAWVQQPRGIQDLLSSLNLLFGKR